MSKNVIILIAIIARQCVTFLSSLASSCYINNLKLKKMNIFYLSCSLACSIVRISNEMAP
jgi:hypothetical protein